MTSHFYILHFRGLHLVVTEGSPDDHHVQAAVSALRKQGVQEPCYVVSEAEMERSGWIRKTRANQYADYRY